MELRSDTFTLPSEGMKAAMFSCALGDDVFGEDPTVNELEKKMAEMFGKEAAIFCPSGTMTNQIAMMLHCMPGDEIICEQFAHVYRYEGGGMMTNAAASPKLIKAERGIIKLSEVEGLINNPKDPHFPLTKLLCLENTCNQGGGSIYPKKNLSQLSNFCRNNNLKIHLDGARLFNALLEADYTREDIGVWFDTISICLSKGLGALVGSVLIGSETDILKARRIRKRLGGGMRQAGILAAAGIYALDNNIELLRQDHILAKGIGDCLSRLDWVTEVKPIETNIVIFSCKNAKLLVEKLAALDVYCLALNETDIRMVCHLNFSREQCDALCQILENINLD